MKKTGFLLLLLMTPLLASGAELGSIANSRFGSNWTLDGPNASNMAAKATNPANFGPGGTVSEPVNVTHTADPITPALLSGFDVFFIGYLADGSPNAFSPAELTAMSDFVTAGGSMIVTCDSPSYDAVCEHFGFTVTTTGVGPTTPTAAGLAHPVFVGPFGNVPAVSMTGTRGYYSGVGTATTIGQDINDKPTVLVATFGAGNVIAYSDIDMTSSYGGGTAGGDIVSDNDRFWGNILAFALDSTITENPDTARFNVTKTFSDGRTDEVDVTLTCTTGLPLVQSQTIAGGDPVGVTFVVTEIEGPVDCEVTESGGPAGYTALFNGTADGCTWEGSVAAGNLCEISNVANPGAFTAWKEWNLINDGGDEVNTLVPVTIHCDRDILTSNGTIAGNKRSATRVIDDGGYVEVTVDTTGGAADCYATESIQDSGVESTDDCGTRSIAAGGSSSCTFVNTVFFEGIPTLSQYGLALLALLMLGVGLVGFRRFA